MNKRYIVVAETEKHVPFPKRRFLHRTNSLFGAKEVFKLAVRDNEKNYPCIYILDTQTKGLFGLSVTVDIWMED